MTKLKYIIWGVLLFVPIWLAAQSTLQDSFPNMKKLTINKGNHFVNFGDRIFNLRNKPEVVEWHYVFLENSNYNLGDEDQKDWNKLTGLFFNLFNTRAETVMIGWRYNIQTDRIELNAYYHINKKRIFTKSLLEVKRGELVKVKINVDYQNKNYTVHLTSNGKTVQHTQTFRHNRGLCGQINFYFGGNRKAPQAMSVLMEEIEE